MFGLLLGLAASGLAQKEFKPFNARANYSEPLDSLLLPRELTVRQQYCDPGYGSCNSGGCCPLNSGCCGSGCINKANTCCYGRVCPPGSSCCGYEGYCKPLGYGCCGSNGDIYPLDGSDCCSDGNHCPPGSSCVSCSDGSGICCRGSNGDYIDPTVQTGLASVTYPPDSQSTYYSTSYDAEYSTYDYSYTPHSYFYTTYTYFFITWIPLYTPTTSSTVTTTTILSAFATDSMDASSSFSADVVSIQSDVSWSQSLYSPETLAPVSTLSSESGTFDASAAVGTSSAAPGAHTSLIAGILALLSVVIGMLAVML